MKQINSETLFWWLRQSNIEGVFQFDIFILRNCDLDLLVGHYKSADRSYKT